MLAILRTLYIVMVYTHNVYGQFRYTESETGYTCIHTQQGNEYMYALNKACDVVTVCVWLDRTM